VKTVVLGPPPAELEAFIIADPADRTVRVFRADGGTYVEIDGSELLGVAAADLTGRISWP
jgi:hypothetical protein